MPRMLSDLSAFLLALLPHWWVFLTSGPASFDRVVRNYSATYAEWADKRWDAKSRARLFRQIAYAGILFAAFLAFSDEHHKLATSRLAADNLAVKRQRIYTSNYFKAATELHEKLRGVLPIQLGNGGWGWIGYVDNPSSVKLAEELIKSFKQPALLLSIASSPEDDINGEGLTLLVREPGNPTLGDKKLIDAFHASGFTNIKLGQLGKEPEYAQQLFGLYVSYPPLEGGAP